MIRAQSSSVINRNVTNTPDTQSLHLRSKKQTKNILLDSDWRISFNRILFQPEQYLCQSRETAGTYVKPKQYHKY